MSVSEGPSTPRRDVRVESAEEYPDLHAPELYLNRELTWLAFARRVLAEAEDARNPLLERVKFLAILGSSLDEFVMKRIGGLKRQSEAGVRKRTVDGRTPQEQIAACHEAMRELAGRAELLFVELSKLLGEQGIRLARGAELSPDQRAWVREHYLQEIFPLVTPQAMDPAYPFPFVSNLSLNLLVTLRSSAREPGCSRARVKVPVGSGIPRWLAIDGERVFIRLEDVIAQNLDLLFPGMYVDRCETFRVTRNADTERDEEEADDLVSLIESELRERKFAPIVRLEIARGMLPEHRGMLAAELGLDEAEDVFELDGMLGKTDLGEIARLDVPELHDPPHHPVDVPELVPDRNIFHVIRDERDVLVHHPYQSFATSVERFLREASEDPKVRAVKMTLYRTSEDSRVVQHLIHAARNGKQVAVVVELKARFDEEANIRWANRLEAVGIHVTYGIVGLKTHAKVILVVRQDFDGLRRYAHLGTGNYHSGTARLYSDLGLFTCDEDIGHDLTELFNYLTTGYQPQREYRKLLPAPKHLKPALLEKIAREIHQHGASSRGRIQMKMNALEDADITRALYEATRAGVRVDLIVRDTCRLRPGLEDLSESARVTSILGRFLEHARIFYFRNGGDEEYFIGSADLMKRNLESRVETVFPVEARRLREELRFILDSQLADRRSAWEMRPDGTYERRYGGDSANSSQELFARRAEERHREAPPLRGRKTKGIVRDVDS